MTLVADAIDLGRLRGHDASSGPQHRLVYLPEGGLIAMPCTRMSGGWHCVIVAARTNRREHHLYLTDDEVTAASRTIPRRPTATPTATPTSSGTPKSSAAGRAATPENSIFNHANLPLIVGVGIS